MNSFQTTRYKCMLTYGSIKMPNYVCVSMNPLMPGGDKKITHTETNLQLKAADLFKYVRTFFATRH